MTSCFNSDCVYFGANSISFPHSICYTYHIVFSSTIPFNISMIYPPTHPWFHLVRHDHPLIPVSKVKINIFIVVHPYHIATFHVHIYCLCFAFVHTYIPFFVNNVFLSFYPLILFYALCCLSSYFQVSFSLFFKLYRLLILPYGDPIFISFFLVITLAILFLEFLPSHFLSELAIITRSFFKKKNLSPFLIRTFIFVFGLVVFIN